MSSFNAFDEKLLRLKQELRVTTDAEVARALGMTGASLSDRKKRHSFPFELVFALRDRQPGSALDVVYVLTGARIHGHAKVSTEALLRASHERGDQDLMRIAHDAAEAAAAHQQSRQSQYELLRDLADFCDDEHLGLALSMMRALMRASGQSARERATSPALGQVPERPRAEQVCHEPVERIDAGTAHTRPLHSDMVGRRRGGPKKR